MRVLIAAAVLAVAAAAPSLHGAGLGYGAHGLHGAGLLHAAPTIPPGDLQGAAIDAHVEATDHARAAGDAAREAHDQASEIAIQQHNAAEDHSWQALDNAQTYKAQIDGAAAGVAPVLAKQLAGHGAYAAPLAHGYAAPLAQGYAAPLAHGYAAPLAHGYAAPLAHGYAAPLSHGYAGHGSTVVQQSLSQSHPAPAYHAPALTHAAYGHGLHGW